MNDENLINATKDGDAGAIEVKKLAKIYII